MTPANNSKSSDLYNVLIGMVLAGLILAVAVVGGLRLLESLGPRIGDIIAFDRSRREPTDMQARITVTPTSGLSATPCILDVRVMWAAGGSLVIEALQLQPSPSFRVHWAGGRTSEGVTDCGTTADFRLSRSEIVTLTFAAGGKGITGGKT